MTRTSQRRIPVAQEFVRIGFGDAIDDNAPFYSHDFLTQELTTLEAQAVIPVVKRYNNFEGEKVATAISRFRGRESLVAELRAMFLDELDADRFEADGVSEYVYGAFWG